MGSSEILTWFKDRLDENKTFLNVFVMMINKGVGQTILNPYIFNAVSSLLCNWQAIKTYGICWLDSAGCHWHVQGKGPADLKHS